MALILPEEASENQPVFAWLRELVAGNGPIRKLFFVDVRQSMSNGGGPACLRLRVVCDPTTVDQRFLADEAKLDAIGECIAANWPDAIAPDDLGSADLEAQLIAARRSLLRVVGLGAIA
jgi:succinylarginine dihydrolase